MPGTPHVQRRLPLVLAVLGFHVLGIWALQSGLVHQAAEHVIPVHVLAELMEEAPVAPSGPQPPKRVTEPPAAPKPASPPVPQPPIPATRPDTPAVVMAASLPPAQPPSAVPSPASASDAAPVMSTAPVTAQTPAPARAELPSSSPRYLHNPRPAYPQQSRRLGEQGDVVIRALIDTHGRVTQAEIRNSSGYESLDQAALQAVQRWRFVPGKRNGAPEAMWINVPLSFVTE